MKMGLLRTLSLKVELSVGAGIRDAACDLCELAARVGVLVEADFNGVLLLARPGDNPLALVDAFHNELHSDRTFKIAQDHGHWKA